MAHKTYRGSRLWGGVSSGGPDKAVMRFTQSFSFDAELFPYDVKLNQAWAKALLGAGVLSRAEAAAIRRGLERVARLGIRASERSSGKWEDVHSYVEVKLHKLIGEPAKKLHTGKSRNDQVATDLRMYLMDQVRSVRRELRAVLAVVVDLAEKNVGVVFPGFTHLRQAQPVLFAHYAMAYFEMLRRDYRGLEECHALADEMSLGSAALAGTVYRVDRKRLARELGFSHISRNSLDAVGDRDFVIAFHSWACRLMVHLSRMAEDLIGWSQDNLKWIRLPVEYCTGSSILPQKLNPDVLELARGKTGRVVGHLVQMLTVAKGLPTSYNRDLQEDKEPLFDSVQTVRSVLQIFAGLIRGITVDRGAARNDQKSVQMLATDVADALVSRGVPFREAHGIAAQLVGWCVKSGDRFDQISKQELRSISPHLAELDFKKAISLDTSVQRHRQPGGTARGRVEEAIRTARNLDDYSSRRPRSEARRTARQDLLKKDDLPRRG